MFGKKKTNSSSDKRHEGRKVFSYYMQLTDANTREVVGHLSDISTGGFKLDAETPLPLNKDYEFHLSLTSDVAHKPYMIFKARSKWCQNDPIDPLVYNVGFHLTAMQSEDRDIFVRVIKKYGADKPRRQTAPLRDGRWT